MRPAARLHTIAELLALSQNSRQPLDRMVQTWGRQNRYAGSKDRRDIADRLFAIYRHYGDLTARLGNDEPLLVAMLAKHLLDDVELDEVLALADGSRHAPPPLASADEASLRHGAQTPPDNRADALSVPSWLLPELEAQLGAACDEVMRKMAARAPTDVRVNILKGSRDEAIAALADEDVKATPHPHVETALRLEGSPRLLDGRAYQSGLVEVQDAGAQAVSLMVGAQPFDTVMDFCAGGGGKALAMAAQMQNKGRVLVHDALSERMADVPQRAARAGVDIIETIAPQNLPDWQAQCDVVVADVPCSGAGRWRRAPETKWRLTQDELSELVALQADILQQAAALVKPGGRLVYITCSLLACENNTQVARFMTKNQQFGLVDVILPMGEAGQTQWHPANADSDGLYCAIMQRRDVAS